MHTKSEKTQHEQKGRIQEANIPHSSDGVMNDVQREKKPTLLFMIQNTLKGIFIGMANTIPGVSGGTIAVLTGIYEPLIEFFATFLSKKQNKLQYFKEIAPLLIPVVFGVFLGILLLANFLDIMFEQIPTQTQFLFIGLILGSLPYLVRQSKRTKFKPIYLIPLIICATLLVWMAVRSAQLPDRSTLISAQTVIREITPIGTLILIGGGMLATSAMIVPGLSGSFLMVILGFYATFRAMVVELNLPVILLFLLGAFAGLFLTSRVLSYLFKHHYGYCYFAILGLVIGSVAFLWPLGIDAPTLLSSILFLLAGATLAFVSSRGTLFAQKTSSDNL